MDNDTALLAGERILNMERLFNTREGFSRKDDTLPQRFLREGMPSGPSKGQVVELAKMLDEFYAEMGWDAEGIPTPETLKRTGLDKIK